MANRQSLSIQSDGFLDFLDLAFVALVKRPAFDSFGLHELCVAPGAHVFAESGQRDAKSFSEQDSADSVFHKISIHLRAEVGAWDF